MARERRADFIDAEVTRLQTNYEIGPDVDVSQLSTNDARFVVVTRSLKAPAAGLRYVCF